MNKPTHTIEHHTIKLSDSVWMRFCRIPACPEGFLMGSRGYSEDEEPIHRVVIPEDFWMNNKNGDNHELNDSHEQKKTEHAVGSARPNAFLYCNSVVSFVVED